MEKHNEVNVKKPIPGPDERPDLYDAYDGIDRPEGYKTGVEMPDYIQKMIEERKAKQQQPAVTNH
ncbi:hypothetical protein [Nitrosomonas sp. Nm132]|jgi:hypothetical protein|uniref:hypothetical protein n=1 Tax=Nitrosomonas sp. Nm132 TaxID=1881053 RepID=UPI00088CCD4B|nr:hypothetical protein [Nitrosomonas sp. Nm132]SDH26809.1 hypothetical protein SAMN05428952_100958 [Nitrosomonas sp. Nm132]